jgi:acyl carrier protein
MNAQVPKGIEVLVKKASVDPAFRTVLLERRAAAAQEIGLELNAAETMTLASVPTDQLETIIAQTDVPQEHRRAFLGHAAMLAALGGVVTRVSSVQAGSPKSGTMVGGMMADEPNSGSSPKKKKPVVESPEEIERRIVVIIAKRFHAAGVEVGPKTSLADDLHADTDQRAGLKRQLEKQFKVVIPKKDFADVGTVGDVVKCVQDVVKRKKQRDDPAPPMRESSGGIRPK